MSGLLLIAATPFVPKTDKDASWLALLGLAASLLAFAWVVAWLIALLVRALYRCVTPFNSLVIYYISAAREILEDWARAADGSQSKKSTWLYRLSVRRVEGELKRPGPRRRRFATRSAREWERQQRIRVALEVAFADVQLQALPQASVTHAQWILDRVYLQALWNDWSLWQVSIYPHNRARATGQAVRLRGQWLRAWQHLAQLLRLLLYRWPPWGA